MNIAELKARVASIPQELDHLHIIMAKDDEGNGYRQFHNIDVEAFVKEDPTDWEIEYVYEDYELDEDDEAIRVAVLW